MRKKRILLKIKYVVILITLLFLISVAIIHTQYPVYSNEHKWIREYVIGEEGMKGEYNLHQFHDDPVYEVGANQFGFVVFKNPEKAFKKMKKDYKEGLLAIKKEFKLPSINRFNFYKYKNLSCQLPQTYEEYLQKQAYQICVFIGVYTDSFSDIQLYKLFMK